MQPAVEERNERVERCREWLNKLAKAPSQFPAESIRNIAYEADTLINTMLIDLKGWEAISEMGKDRR